MVMCNDYTNAGGQPTAAVEQKQAAAQVLQEKAKEGQGSGEIVVFGRATCGWCTKVKGDFDKAGI